RRVPGRTSGHGHFRVRAWRDRPLARLLRSAHHGPDLAGALTGSGEGQFMTIATANIFTTPCEPMPDVLAPTGDAAERFEARIAMVGAALGMRQLGCNLFTVPAGKRAFPFHNHHAVEELFIIIEGQ